MPQGSPPASLRIDSWSKIRACPPGAPPCAGLRGEKQTLSPREIAAPVIDRASRWTVFTRITLPMSAPRLGLAVLFRATNALEQFDLVMAVSGPNDARTQTLSTLLYQVVFRDGMVGLGSAYACTVLVVVIALATVFTRDVD